MTTRIRQTVIGTILALLAIIAIFLGMIVSASQSNARTYDRDPYIPLNILVGPGTHDTFFTITDSSTNTTIRYLCGFLSPKHVATNPDGEKLFVPQVQCNVG